MMQARTTKVFIGVARLTAIAGIGIVALHRRRAREGAILLAAVVVAFVSVVT